MRLYYAHVGSSFVDIEWDPEAVMKYKKRITSLYKLIHRLYNIDKKPDVHLDNWLKSRMTRHIQSIKDNFSIYDLRNAANEIFFEIYKDLQWYEKRDGGTKDLLHWFIDTWLQLMTPFSPHICEELWHLYHDSYISIQNYPTFDTNNLALIEEVGEYLLAQSITDTQEILKVTKIQPTKICFYTAAPWKYNVLLTALKLSNQDRFDIGTLMKEIMQDETIRNMGKQVSKYAGKLLGEIKKLQPRDKQRYEAMINETKYLLNARSFIINMFTCPIEIYQEDDKEKYDPQNKAYFAVPLRPAIYIE
jgi:leucyl-tRNA synthetase